MAGGTALVGAIGAAGWCAARAAVANIERNPDPFSRAQLAREEAPRLITELGYALIYERLVELIVLVHGMDYMSPARTARNTLWLCGRRRWL